VAAVADFASVAPQAGPPRPPRPHAPSLEELAAHQAMLAAITQPLWLAAG
jgi:DNA polymerase III subunit epsilon